MQLTLTTLAATTALFAFAAPSSAAQIEPVGPLLPYNGENDAQKKDPKQKEPKDGSADAKKIEDLLQKGTDPTIKFVLRQMEQLIDMGQQVDFSIRQMRDTIDFLPGGPADAYSEREEMLAALDEFAERAAEMHIDEGDVQVLRTRLFWARVDGTIVRAQRIAEQKNWSVPQLAADLQPKTGGICTNYVPRTARRHDQRLRQAFVRVETFAGSPGEFGLGVRSDLIQSRLQQARQVLRFRVHNSSQTRADYAQVYRLLRLRSQMFNAAARAV